MSTRMPRSTTGRRRDRVAGGRPVAGGTPARRPAGARRARPDGRGRRHRHRSRRHLRRHRPAAGGHRRDDLRRLPAGRSGGHGALQDRGPGGPGARRVRARRATSTSRSRGEKGPFGDHTGYYSLADDYPVLHLTALTHRRDAIYSTTIVGQAPMEDTYLGKATERLFLPLLQAHSPRTRRHGPAQGGRLPQLCLGLGGQALPAAGPQESCTPSGGPGRCSSPSASWSSTRDVDVHDYAQVAWRVFNNVDWQRDVTIVEGPLDVLDHSSPHPLRGGKIGIDATRQVAGGRPPSGVAGRRGDVAARSRPGSTSCGPASVWADLPGRGPPRARRSARLGGPGSHGTDSSTPAGSSIWSSSSTRSSLCRSPTRPPSWPRCGCRGSGACSGSRWPWSRPAVSACPSTG